MNTKRFLVFAYDDYYPAGGWGDLQGAFDTLKEAMSFCMTDAIIHYDSSEIIDLHDLQIISGTEKYKELR